MASADELNICTVCGSRPACCNFGGITCASCKMFFRRNEAFDLATNRCRFNRTCDVSVSNRRTCRYCRLQKCVAVGMRRELFRSPHGQNVSRRTEPIYPRDLLDHDRSALTTDQWALLSNVVYDGECPIREIQQQMSILTDPVQFLTLQNTYVEVMFKYMLFRYGYAEASKRFARLIQVVLEQNKCLQTLKEVEPHQAMVKEIVSCVDDSSHQ